MEFIKFFLIHLVIPGIGFQVFLWLREGMLEDEIENPPVIQFFMIFATYGGWLLLVLTGLFWYWSGMALLVAMSLMFLAPVIMLLQAVRLYQQRNLSPYHRGAFLLSAGYLLIPIAVIVIRSLWGLTDG